MRHLFLRIQECDQFMQEVEAHLRHNGASQYPPFTDDRDLIPLWNKMRLDIIWQAYKELFTKPVVPTSSLGPPPPITPPIPPEPAPANSDRPQPATTCPAPRARPTAEHMYL